jgi:hypothetical protein
MSFTPDRPRSSNMPGSRTANWPLGGVGLNADLAGTRQDLLQAFEVFSYYRPKSTFSDG